MNFILGMYTMVAVFTVVTIIEKWNAYKLRKELKEFLDDE